MNPERIIAIPGWVRPIGHVGGVVARGRHIFLAGQLGWDAQAHFAATDLVGQVRQALSNIVTLLARAGAGPEHITRMTWYLTDKHEYQRRLPAIALAYAELIGREFPPLTAVAVASLMHDEALVEIDLTAVVDVDD
jgi:enamine deaminase RidA (YjgF/YER057c/UK114 family)